MIVSDAGPILIFARIGRISLLRDVTGSLLIPDVVYEEIVFKKVGMPGAAEVAQSEWIQRANVINRSMLDNLPTFSAPAWRALAGRADKKAMSALRRAAALLNSRTYCPLP